MWLEWTFSDFQAKGEKRTCFSIVQNWLALISKLQLMNIARKACDEGVRWRRAMMACVEGVRWRRGMQVWVEGVHGRRAIKACNGGLWGKGVMKTCDKSVQGTITGMACDEGVPKTALKTLLRFKMIKQRISRIPKKYIEVKKIFFHARRMQWNKPLAAEHCEHMQSTVVFRTKCLPYYYTCCRFLSFVRRRRRRPARRQ